MNIKDVLCIDWLGSMVTRAASLFRKRRKSTSCLCWSELETLLSASYKSCFNSTVNLHLKYLKICIATSIGNTD